PLGGGSRARQPWEYQIPRFDPVLEAQGGYGPQTIRRARPDVLAALQRDVTSEGDFVNRAHAQAARQYALLTAGQAWWRGTSRYDRSGELLRRSLLSSALSDRDLQARYQRERYGFDPTTRRFNDEMEIENIPGLGNMRRAIDLLQRVSAGTPQPRLGEGLERTSARYQGYGGS
ncbi:MAG: hypothetical protein ACRDJE_08255, partial [Dehalococcoidia bacterium]